VPETAGWFFLCSGACILVAVPMLLRGIKGQSPEVFRELGEPSNSRILSRDPNNWRIQWRFMVFVLSGKANAVVSGRLKIAALVAFAGYAGLLLFVAMLALMLIVDMTR